MKIMRAACVIICVTLICLSLSGCRRVIRGPRDELVMYSWGADMDNGNKVSLVFDGDKAAFRAENDAFTLEVGGVYLIDDESLIICDEATYMNHRFDYTVHGDCVDLSFGDGTITLDKLAPAENAADN